MKKNFKYFAVIWAILLALFNVICFVTPDEMNGMSKFGGAFWVGYIFITIAFVGQLICAFIAFKAENIEKMFYNVPLISLSFIGLIVMAVVGALTMRSSPKASAADRSPAPAMSNFTFMSQPPFCLF